MMAVYDVLELQPGSVIYFALMTNHVVDAEDLISGKRDAST